MRACDVIKPEIIERLLNQLLLKQRTQKPVINAMMAADQEYRSSIKSAGVDALALRADEGRDKLRKASGRSKYPLIRRYPNGETHLSKPQVSIK